MERGWKPNVGISPSCPRCGSSNTKFCYYNNYSLTQPHYFCKGCRRYWTKGGSLRNVPVGGGLRKNGRGKSLRLSSTSDHAAQSRSSAYGGGGANKGSSSSVDQSCCSSLICDGSHIDLALVYANFLNPQHPSDHSCKITANTTTGFGMQELPSDYDPSLDLSSITRTNLESRSFQLHANNSSSNSNNNSLSVATGFRLNTTMSDSSIEVALTNNDGHHHHFVYYCGVDPITNKYEVDNKIQRCTNTHHNTIHHGLPPVPGEGEILWSNSYSMDNAHPTLQQVTQEAVISPENQDPNLLFHNWSPFDLSCDDAFSRT